MVPRIKFWILIRHYVHKQCRSQHCSHESSYKLWMSWFWFQNPQTELSKYFILANFESLQFLTGEIEALSFFGLKKNPHLNLSKETHLTFFSYIIIFGPDKTWYFLVNHKIMRNQFKAKSFRDSGRAAWRGIPKGVHRFE